MALERASAGDVIDVHELGPGLARTPTHALYKSESIEVVRIVLPAGKTLPRHAVAGPITLQCLEGEVDFELPRGVVRLGPGSLICIEGATPHALSAITDASLLLTIVLRAR
jgi:quercetin dioxygenase-like cupin family protein